MRTEDQRLRDRLLLETVESHRSIGEQRGFGGEVPAIDLPPPPIPGSETQKIGNSVDDSVGNSVGNSLDVDGTPVAPMRSVRRRIRPRMLQVGAAVVAIVAGYFAVTLWQVWSTGRSDQARPVDAIVVMGAAQYDGRPSPQLEARLDHVVELWPQGLAPLIVVTGGSRPGDRFTEASASADYLVERGVPASAILLEGDGTSSYESLDVVDALLEARGLDSVLIVTDPYHSLRSRLIAQSLGLRAYVSPTPTSVVRGARSFERQVGEAAGVAVGRIIGFEWLDALTD